ncbi:tyrosine-type recombinase/integrase [Oceanospirillum linum]|uniref:Integrase n=1 Tax=Oceanospirillum linum TaxID=966 RepID=A0A1T1H8K4_OCELI|nr:integrase arm-type DNA-binding domain-containing protein [Oceanospirillum linum]OOV86204.1 integrase [Oceanospirillum linum]SEG38280.1 Site-specific recombinase XerD [Oleiphilus messinensis]SMP32154.1 Site-specific recombinase XerD [Oceanospirillum linum]
MPLTAKAISAAQPKEKDYKLSDEKGLYLLITKTNKRYWRLKYRFAGKEKVLAIGVYPEVSLKEARAARDKARQQLAEHIDPSMQKQIDQMIKHQESDNSFKRVALEWFETKMADKSEKHRKRTKSAIERDLFPYIGKRPISDIKAIELLTVLKKIISERQAVETAHRVKQTAGQIFRYAIATGRTERDPTRDLDGSLPSPKEKHLAAITDPKDVGRLMVAIDEYNATPVVKAALRLSPLWFCRPGELRHMRWDQVNWEEKRIELQASKTHQEHIIPLSRQSLEILEELALHTRHRSEFLFPSARGASRPMSDNAVRTALRSMGYDNDTMTAHGFRAMARTLLDEVLGFRVEWIEQQLAHAVKDPNGRAYNRTKHLNQRFEMMQRWADYLDDLKAQALTGNVISASFGAKAG